MILLDSNILIYTINLDSPKCLTAQRFITEHKKELCIAQQNIFESLRVLTHPKYSAPMTPAHAIEAITAISDNLVLINPTYETKFVALELIKNYEITSDRIFDAYLAATMLTNEVARIATDNESDFTTIKEVSVINPFRLRDGIT